MKGLLITATIGLLFWAAWVQAAEQLDFDVLAARAQIRYPDVPRKVLAFYYPWYGNPESPGGSGRWYHWEKVDQVAKSIASSTDYPLLGPYDSHDPKVIAQHCEWAKRAGVDGFIVSWWGHGGFEDRAMPSLLQACEKAGLEVTIYYETVPAPLTAGSAAKDILPIVKRYGSHPAWLKVAGKPVLFIYGRAVQQIGMTLLLLQTANPHDDRMRIAEAQLLGQGLVPGRWIELGFTAIMGQDHDAVERVAVP